MNATGRLRAVEASPTVPVNQMGAVVKRAKRDASDLAVMVREHDPREVWGQLALWAEEDLVRLCAATVTLAAMVDVDQPVSDLLAWVEDLRGRAT